MSTPLNWCLQAETGGAPRPVPEPGLVCGSWTQADLVLPDNNQTPPVLSYLRRQQDVLTIQRACADGQVAVNGIELPVAQIQTLQNGDRLTLGEMNYRVESGLSPAQPVDVPAAAAPVADPFADLHVPGLIPVGGPMPTPSDKHPFDTPAKAADLPSTDSSIPAASWQPELGRAPEWISTLSKQDNEFDLLQGTRQV